MAPGSRAPFPCPPRANRRTRASRGEFAGSCSCRLSGRVTILPFGLRLLLLAPAAEFCVSPNHHLQRGVDDVIRGTLDEGRIFFYCKCDWLLQFVFALHHLRWLVNDGHWSSPLLSFSSWPYWDAGQIHRQQRLSLFAGLERPPRFPWQRSGVAPAQPSVLPASKIDRRARRNLCALHNFRSPQR